MLSFVIRIQFLFNINLFYNNESLLIRQNFVSQKKFFKGKFKSFEMNLLSKFVMKKILSN